MELVVLALTLLLFLILTTFSMDDNGPYTVKRWDMVERQIISRGIQNSKVIQAMLKVPRHKFVPEDLRDSAYNDSPLPIGMEQTISQPYIVALMTVLLNPKDGEKILEVGTGSGYQTAVIAETGCEVYTIEILEPVADKAEQILRGLGYEDIHFKIGDGYRGWEEYAPFDAIIVTAAPDHIPQPLINQLKVKGRMIIPVGALYQDLLLIRKTEKGVDMKTVTPVRFVPMTGEAKKSGEQQ
ncbi:MAG TPA: protein-L-isoaspartate(D-aspartate) O-methyltransferase [Thermodesulfobacteriota bacterium]|nr:protein-L-isoaspartate(D-aspartate) O-methyltransferase [Thermodesulfobacteriota bacterium]